MDFRTVAERFPNEDVWAAECTRVLTMMKDLLTLGFDPVTIPKKDVETLMLFIIGMAGAMESE
jgi:hypothetical protein